MTQRDADENLAPNRRQGYSVAHVARAAQRALSCGSHPAASNFERWYCFRTAFHMHEEATGQLDRQGFLTFFPLFRRRRPSGKIDVYPLFPRYGFVRLDLGHPRWRAVYSTRGVETLLGVVAERPSPLPVGVIEGLLAQLSPAGWIEDPSLKPDVMPIQPGVFVKVKSGPFTAMRGVCTWSTSKRLAVLLDLFGRQTEIEMAVTDAAEDDDAE